jgi:hypothetical protein
MKRQLLLSFFFSRNLSQLTFNVASQIIAVIGYRYSDYLIENRLSTIIGIEVTRGVGYYFKLPLRIPGRIVAFEYEPAAILAVIYRNCSNDDIVVAGIVDRIFKHDLAPP